MDLGSTSQLILYLVFVSLIDMLHLTGGLIIIGLSLGVLEGVSNRYLVRAFGMKGVLFTAWIGTPIHELSHAIMCFVFHHRVKRIKLLQLRSTDGMLGYVEHQYNPGSLYQKIGSFFIGIAPIIGGAFAILLCMYFTVPDSYHVITLFLKSEVTGVSVSDRFSITLSAILLLIKSLFNFHHFLKPFFWLFLFLAICISSNMALSKADMKGASSGLTAFFIVIFFINGVARFLHIATSQINIIISRVNIYVLTLVGVALIFSLVTVILSYLLFIGKGLIANWRK